MLICQPEAANRCILILSFCVLRPTSPNRVQLYKRALPQPPRKVAIRVPGKNIPQPGGDSSSLAVYCCLLARFCPEGIGTEPARSRVSGSRVLPIASGLLSETGTVIFREGMALLVGEKCRNRPHWHVDVIGAIPVRECFKLVQNVVAVLICERWNSTAISHRSVA